MNKELFINELEKLGIHISDKQYLQLEEYCNFLQKYNEHTNLTAITEKESVFLKHFYDSLTITKAIDLNKITSIADIGCGAGFPGLVLKIIYPHLEVTLLDSNNKKTQFLSEISKLLKLDKVTIIHDRAEQFAINNLDKYDLVTARAVTSLPVLTELCLPLVKVNGYFIPLKGNVEEEITLSQNIIKILNGNLEKVISFNLPIEESVRNIVVIKKYGNNPMGYPRPYDKIKKSLKNNNK